MPSPTNNDIKIRLSFVDQATGKFKAATKEQIAAAKKAGMEVSKSGKSIETSYNKVIFSQQRLTNSNKKVVESSKKVARQSKRTSQEYVKHAGNMRGATGGLTHSIGKLRNTLLLVAFAYQGINRLIVPAIKLARAQEMAERKLEAALLNSGLASQEQVKNLKELANAQQNSTIFSNEQIINAQAQMATFKLNALQIAEMTPLLLDMSTAVQKLSGTEVDLQAVSIAFSKGVTGQTGALSRYGVVLSETAKKSGDFSTIMKEIKEQYEGIAKTIGRTTFEGQVKMTANAFGDLQKQWGNIIVQSPAILAVFELYRESLFEQTEEIKRARVASNNYVSVWDRLAAAIIGVAGFFRVFWRSFLLGIQTIKWALISFVEGILRLLMKIPELRDKLTGITKDFIAYKKAAMDDMIEQAPSVLAVWDEMMAQYEKFTNKTKELEYVTSRTFQRLKPVISEASLRVIENMEKMKESFDSTMESMKKSAESATSDIFYDTFIGNSEKFLVYWEKFTQAILRSFANMLAEMLIKGMAYKAIMGALGLVSAGASTAGAAAGSAITDSAGSSLSSGSLMDMGQTLHTGGVVKPKRYGSGGVVPAWLETGEGVVSRSGMTNLGKRGLDMINRGQSPGSGGTVNNYYIDAIDVRTFRDYMAQNQDIAITAVSGDFDSNDILRKRIKGGL